MNETLGGWERGILRLAYEKKGVVSGDGRNEGYLAGVINIAFVELT